MKVTKRQLRQIIKEEKRKILREQGQWPKNPDGSEYDPVVDEEMLGGNEDEIAEAIEWYKSSQGNRIWQTMAYNDFANMAAGDALPGVRDKFYSGWEDHHFQQVIDGVEG